MRASRSGAISPSRWARSAAACKTLRETPMLSATSWAISGSLWPSSLAVFITRQLARMVQMRGLIQP